jgi:hypothetical protein
MTPPRHLLVTALWCALHDRPAVAAQHAVNAVRAWLSTWSGIGLVAAGMARKGYDLQLTCYAEEGWRATFYVSGCEHSPHRATGSVCEPTPWRAVQVAAWEALRADGLA